MDETTWTSGLDKALEGLPVDSRPPEDLRRVYLTHLKEVNSQYPILRFEPMVSDNQQYVRVYTEFNPSKVTSYLDPRSGIHSGLETPGHHMVTFDNSVAGDGTSYRTYPPGHKKLAAIEREAAFFHTLEQLRAMVYAWRWENETSVKLGMTSQGIERWSDSRPTDVSPAAWETLVESRGDRIFVGVVDVPADELADAESMAHSIHGSRREGTSEFFDITPKDAAATLKVLARAFGGTVHRP
jgi:hypothetical protein